MTDESAVVGEPSGLRATLTPGRLADSVLLTLTGEISIESAQGLLRRLWDDPRYADSSRGIWDVSACELPDFDNLRQIAEFVRREKRDRGFQRSAIVSPDFAHSVLTRALSGFSRLARLNFIFVTDIEAGWAWLGQQPHD